MSHFFGSVWWFLVTLGVLVTFHEFGHFWVARRCGVRVLKFSVGFGKPLWSRKGKDGVEYAIGAIPLGGYVKFLDAREADDPEYVTGQAGEFNAAPVWQRMAIAAAGPAFNFVFTIVAFWAMFVIGKPDYPPVIDVPQGLAADAGLGAGDRIQAVDGVSVNSWSSAISAIGNLAVLHRDARLDIVDAQGRSSTRILSLSKLPADINDFEKVRDAIGLAPKPSEAVVGELPPGPAANAGMRVDDRVVSINGVAVKSFQHAAQVIQEQAAKDPQLRVTVERGGTQQTLLVLAEPQQGGDKTVWRIGIGLGQKDGHSAIERYGPLQAIPAALSETWAQTKNTASLIYHMLAGHVSAKNLSGVIGIAQAADFTAQMGVGWFLMFLATVSLSLGILNLLPIPILDGGHLLYYLIELIKGRPLSERVLIAGQYVGLALLVTLMSMAFYNDIMRLIAG